MSGRVLVFTGDGKGKTTAALGIALRAVGHGMQVKIIQFVKCDSSTGEIAALNMLPGVGIVQAGCGFIPNEANAKFTDHRQAAENGLKLAAEAIESGTYSVVILDEICVAVSKKLLNEAEVIEIVRGAAPDVTVVLTGRGATPAIIELADTVTNMNCVKHGMQVGIRAQEGVEF